MRAVALSLALVLGCGKSKEAAPPPPAPSPPPAAPAVPAKVAKPSAVTKLLADTRSADKKVAEQALSALTFGKEPFTADEGLEIFAATIPNTRSSNWSHILHRMHPDTRYVAVVEARFTSFETARHAALVLLSQLDDAGAATTFVKLARQSMDLADTWSFLDELVRKPHHPEIIVPLLFEFPEGNSKMDVLPLLEHYCDRNMLPPAVIAPHVDALLAGYRAQRAASKAMKPDDYDYQSFPGDLQAALHVFRCLPVAAVVPDLTEALAAKDPIVVLAAMTSLFDLEQPVPDAVIARLAAAPESRKAVFDELTHRDAIARMPAKYRTQPMLAEGEISTSEGGYVRPSKTTLAKVISVDTKTDGMLDVYVFRLAYGKDIKYAVTGAYLRKETPTTKLYGETLVDSETPGQKVEAYAPGPDVILANWKDESDGSDAPTP